MFFDYRREMTPGAKVRLARESRSPRWSQQALADATGLKKSKIANWETDRAEPRERDMALVAKALLIPLRWFFDGTPAPPPVIPDMGMGMNPPGSVSPGASEIRGTQPGVGRRYFPIVGRAGAAAQPLEAGQGFSASDFMDFSDDLNDKVGRDQVVVQVWGDSAEPEFRHGDWVLVTKDPSFRLPGFFAVILNAEHEYLVKLSKRSNGDLEFHAMNPEYEPTKLEEGYEMYGFVVGWKREKAPGKYGEYGDRDGLRPGFKD